MKIQVFQGIVLVLVFASTSVLGQSQNEYSIGVDSHGNYGFSLNRGSDNSLFQISYSSLNMNRLFRLNSIPAQQHIFTSQVNTVGLAYFRKRPVSSNLNLYYGGSINWGNSPIRPQVSSQRSLTNLNLQLGFNYRLTDKISVGAEFRQSYNNFWMNNFMPAWQSSPMQTNWLSW
ncbi:MAG: hypothetical protein ACP5PZ_00220 [Bacteroidales bacterium]